MIDLSLTSDLFINDEFTAALQELDIIFNTENTELLGDPDYGVNLEQFLWSLTPTTHELTKYINSKIDSTLFASQFRPKVNIEFIEGDFRTIYKISISLTNPSDNNIYTKKYQYK